VVIIIVRTWAGSTWAGPDPRKSTAFTTLGDSSNNLSTNLRSYFLRNYFTKEIKSAADAGKAPRALSWPVRPSPTGPLHFGSLVAAVASYLDAKTRHGMWLVRMEDLDPPREVPGAADSILRTLEGHALYWDEPVLFQSQRHGAYQAALDSLRQRGLIYHCSCSRRELTEQQTVSGLPVYPGTCRTAQPKPGSQSSLRDFNRAAGNRV